MILDEVSTKVININDPNFNTWAKDKIIDLNEYVLGVHDTVKSYEDIIACVNKCISNLYDSSSLFLPKQRVVLRERPCFEKKNSWPMANKNIWYPSILYCISKNSLVLGVSVYEVSSFLKEETFKDSFDLYYENMNYSPEAKRAYKLCVEAIPALVLKYEDYIISEVKYD